MKRPHANKPIVDAIYRHESDPQYTGNPFVEALPALLPLDDYQVKLSRIHKVAPEERAMSAEQRLLGVGRLFQCCVALPRVVNMAQSIHMNLFEGYRTRSPFTESDQQNAQRLYELQQSGKLTDSSGVESDGQYSMGLAGVPGSGKSYILRRIADMFPKVIYHRELGKYQIPFLFVEMPYDGQSYFSLASQIFIALDKVMPDSNLFRSYVASKQRFNALQLCLVALDVAYEQGVGMIVVDEAQNNRSIGNLLAPKRKSSAMEAKAKSAETVLKKLIITASNVSNMPILFTGTMELESTLTERGSFGRRKSGRGSATWKPLSREVASPTQPSEFETFLRGLFEMQWLPKPVAYSKHWEELFFEKTQGVPDLIVKLFHSTQVSAIRDGADSIEPVDVAVALGEFDSAQPIVRGLKMRDEASKLNLPDVFGLSYIEETAAQQMVPATQTLTVSRIQTAADVTAHIEKKVASKAKKVAPRGPAGPRPIDIPEGLVADIIGADLRQARPLSESPLDPLRG